MLIAPCSGDHIRLPAQELLDWRLIAEGIAAYSCSWALLASATRGDLSAGLGLGLERNLKGLSDLVKLAIALCSVADYHLNSLSDWDDLGKTEGNLPICQPACVCCKQRPYLRTNRLKVVLLKWK